MKRIVPMIFLTIVLFPAGVSSTNINIGKRHYVVSISESTIKLTEGNRVLSAYDFSFSYKGTVYNPSIKKVIPVDLDSDGIQELLVLIDPPDMLSPSIVIFYFENGEIHKFFEGINLFAIPYSASKKVDVHTLTLGADVIYYSEGDQPIFSNIKKRLLSSVKKQGIGIVLFPNFQHIQVEAGQFLVDARHLHYNGDNCEKLSFDTPTDIRSTSSNQLIIICNNLLSIIEFRGLDKEIGSIDYGFFTVEYEDNISKIEESDKNYAVYLQNRQKKSLKKSNIKFNYSKNGKWWRVTP